MLIIEKLVADENDARDNLDAIVRQRGEKYALLSRLMGHPNGYLHRWVRAENVERLSDEVRYKLALYFNVDARLFGVPTAEAPKPTPLSQRVARKTAQMR